MGGKEKEGGNARRFRMSSYKLAGVPMPKIRGIKTHFFLNFERLKKIFSQG
jgi:hypothetical protein